jgi:hypothetical protein
MLISWSVKTILQELHDASLRLLQDENISQDELLRQVSPLRMNADRKIREILTNDQKKKLDLYLQEPHSDMHGNLQPMLYRADVHAAP